MTTQTNRDQFIQNNADKMSAQEMATKLGIQKASLLAHARKKGIELVKENSLKQNVSKRSQEEIDLFVRKIHSMSVKRTATEIAEDLDISKGYVLSLAERNKIDLTFNNLIAEIKKLATENKSAQEVASIVNLSTSHVYKLAQIYKISFKRNSIAELKWDTQQAVQLYLVQKKPFNKVLETFGLEKASKDVREFVRSDLYNGVFNTVFN
ncbi:TPA: hypothetical protein ACN33X_001392 [Vibrio parahaemolyticus]|nr:hypothetical protein [Vibrio parahaemolyticus]EIA9324811.1 hypothetical protein [Vibrio parahaemolyticus]EJG1681435.1 hypothetical protein [Vibrio parahaemolyticus]